MIRDLGRGPLELSLVEVETALDEETIDLPIGARGFMLKDRANTAVLRYSNIKGEVSKAVTADPKPKFWTIAAATVFSIEGVRNMQRDAEDGTGTALGAQAAGTVLEQRFYVTSETDATDIEVLIIPGN